MSDIDLTERVARRLASLYDDEPWPTNGQLGGGPTGTRDDEFKDAMRDDARDLIREIREQTAQEIEAHVRPIRLLTEFTSGEQTAYRHAARIARGVS